MTDTIWLPDDAAAITKLRDAMQRLSDYQAGLFPRPDLDKALEDAEEAWSGVDALLTRLERNSVVPDHAWYHLDAEVCTFDTDPERVIVLTTDQTQGFCHEHDRRVYFR